MKRRVEAHTGRRDGVWSVSVVTYAPPQNKIQRIMNVVTLSEAEDRVFLVVSTTVMEVQPAMLAMTHKISNFAPRMTRAVRGVDYDFDDFRVRVGLMFDRHTSPIGVVVEIEYRPCAVISECYHLIDELMNRLAESLVPPPQSGHDRAVNVAAGTRYAYNKVALDEKMARYTDGQPFSNRTSALLYEKLLRSF